MQDGTPKCSPSFQETSFTISMSGNRSASSFFGRVFSTSRLRSRLASPTSRARTSVLRRTVHGRTDVAALSGVAVGTCSG